MTCREGIDEFESQCRGLVLYKENYDVVIENDSCMNECYKVVYRTTKVFPDMSFLHTDTILLCADKKLLQKVVKSLYEKGVLNE